MDVRWFCVGYAWRNLPCVYTIQMGVCQMDTPVYCARVRKSEWASWESCKVLQDDNLKCIGWWFYANACRVNFVLYYSTFCPNMHMLRAFLCYVQLFCSCVRLHTIHGNFASYKITSALVNFSVGEGVGASEMCGMHRCYYVERVECTG